MTHTGSSSTIVEALITHYEWFFRGGKDLLSLYIGNSLFVLIVINPKYIYFFPFELKSSSNSTVFRVDMCILPVFFYFSVLYVNLPVT